MLDYPAGDGSRWKEHAVELSLNMLADFLSDYDAQIEEKVRGAERFTSVRFAVDGTEPPSGVLSIDATDASGDAVSLSINGTAGARSRIRVAVSASERPAFLNSLLRWVEQLQLWSDAMQLTVASGGSFQDLLDESESVLDLPVAISGPIYDSYALTRNHRASDRFFKEIGETGSLGPHSVELLEKMSVFGSLAEDRRVKVFPPNDTITTWHMNRHFRNNGSRSVFITAWCPDGSPTPGKIELFNLFSETAKRLHDSQFKTSALNPSRLGYAFHALFSGAVEPDRIADELALLGITPHASWLVAHVTFADPDATPKTYVAHSMMAQAQNVWAAVHDDGITAIAGLDERERDGRAIERTLLSIARKSDGSIGTSAPFEDVRFLEGAYAQAVFALRTGSAISKEQVLKRKHHVEKTYPTRMFKYNDYRLHRMLQGCSDLTASDSSVRRMIDLASYDVKHGTRKMRLIHAYLQNNRSLQKTADALNLHRNSISYQLNSIAKLTGLDPGSSEFAVIARIAFAALELKCKHQAS